MKDKIHRQRGSFFGEWRDRSAKPSFPASSWHFIKGLTGNTNAAAVLPFLKAVSEEYFPAHRPASQPKAGQYLHRNFSAFTLTAPASALYTENRKRLAGTNQLYTNFSGGTTMYQASLFENPRGRYTRWYTFENPEGKREWGL